MIFMHTFFFTMREVMMYFDRSMTILQYESTLCTPMSNNLQILSPENIHLCHLTIDQ